MGYGKLFDDSYMQQSKKTIQCLVRIYMKHVIKNFDWKPHPLVMAL